MDTLYDSIQRRTRPEDAAQLVLDALGEQLTKRERKVLERAAKGSLKQRLFGFSSMMSDFARPVGLEAQVERARVLFRCTAEGAASCVVVITGDECADPEKVEAFVRALSREIHKSFGQSDFMHDRLDAVQRKAQLGISRRKYNRMWRLLSRMERKLAKLVREQRKYEFTRIGKSGLATRLTKEQLELDLNSACFITYLCSRSNLRSEFTVAGQQRAYDEIADMLFSRCLKSETTSWFAIAHVYPDERVLTRLSEQDKGRLLGVWFEVLSDVAGLLREVYEMSDFNERTMIVKRGNDSTTWNNTASAWNKARSNWISLLHALGLESMLEQMCPGKVMRLMAADVAAWHRSIGGKLSPDTEVWAELPRPWEVLSGERACTRELVEKVCRDNEVDPIVAGWSSARKQGEVAAFRATPELVHGVTISSPHMAAAMKKAGWFSGKKARVAPSVLYEQTITKHRADKERERALNTSD